MTQLNNITNGKSETRPALRALAAGRAGARGQVFVLTALALFVLLGFTAMAVDVGFLWSQRRVMQTAADAAAVGGARDLLNGASTAISSATEDAAANGFTSGQNGATVTINIPPTSGSYAGDSSSVEAIINQTRPTYFLGALGFKQVTLKARAVGHVASAPGCVYVLDPSASAAMTVNGTAATVQLGCGLYINSSAPNALTVNGGSCVNAETISIVGNYSASCTSVAPFTGVPSVQDPLAWLPPPPVGACNFKNFVAKGGGVVPLTPGVYCGGITVKSTAKSPTTAVLSPGIYILDGGGLTVTSGSIIQGSGVMFYNTASSGWSYGPITIGGGATATLSAPTSGTYAGILFFEDRSITSTAVNMVTGSTTSSFQGALYFPNSPLEFSGNSTTNADYTIIVADTLTIQGDSYFGANYSSLADQRSPITNGVLAE